MKRRPTIIDVARAAGVSKSTVSLVLQDSPLVKPGTRDLVRQAMTEIGYVYNRAAANLRTTNAGLIGLVINDLRNPFFTEFATSVQMALSARGYATVLANTNEDAGLQAQVVGAMIEHGVAALVISPCYGDEMATFELIKRTGVPAMQVLRKVDARTDLFPFAAPDYPTGSRMAADHLMRSGARKVAFVGGVAGQPVAQERMSGYLAAMAQIGSPPIIVPGRASRAFGRETAIALTRDHPDVDAAICYNDLVALGMLSGFAELGRPVGREFRLVGFDDIEECAQVFPALTSVRCDISGFGQRLAGTILDWLEAGKSPPAELRTEVSLVIRASSKGATDDRA
jgi:LacI family transcriptional regulator